MFAECPIKVINDHLILTDNGQDILIDTGSPISFHPLGNLIIGDNDFSVQSCIPGVSTQYLSEKVGCEIQGLLGMDIINSMPTLFNLKKCFILIDDNTEYPNHFKNCPLSPLAGGLVAIIISVNGKEAKMIVDSGAPISYIRHDFLSGLESAGIMDDFSPFIGNFQTDTFVCEVDTLTHQNVYRQRFGIPPQVISITLELLNVDGVIGIELFKQYRLQFKNQTVFLPPQETAFTQS